MLVKEKNDRFVRQANTYLLLSIGALLVFGLTWLYYVWNPLDLGPGLITVVNGAMVVVQIVLTLLSIRSMLHHGFHWKALVTIAIAVLSGLLMGYCFLVMAIILMT